MAPTVPFVIDPTASTYLVEAAKSLFDFDGSRTMCGCNLCFLTKDMIKCDHCKCPFDDALEFQQNFIVERFKAEAIAISEAAAAASTTVTIPDLPKGISVAIQNLFKNHLLEAYEEEPTTWQDYIVDAGFGEHPHHTAPLLDTLYKNLRDKDKQKFLNRVRSLEDHQTVDKIQAYADMLNEAKTYADSKA
jgi:hypothetical protein